MRAVPPPSTPRHSVLIVDPTEHIRRFVCLNLAKRGFDVRDAACLEQALRLCHQWRPELILLEMPHDVPDWRAWLSRIRDLRSLSGIPLVIFTTEPYSLIQLKKANGNVVGLLSKPLSAEALVTTVQRTIGYRWHTAAANGEPESSWVS